MRSALASPFGYTEGDIPAGRIDPHAHHHAELLWVRTGMIEMTVDGAAHRLVAGQAIWIPAGVTHALRLEPGTVTVAVWSSSVPKSAVLSEVRVVDITDDWADWLIHKRGLGALAADGPLLELASGCPDTLTHRFALPGCRCHAPVRRAPWRRRCCARRGRR